MKLSFWIKRFLVVFTGGSAVLFMVGALRGRSVATNASESAFWSFVATGIFITTRLIRSRRGEYCELCGDTPETVRGGQCELKPQTGVREKE